MILLLLLSAGVIQFASPGPARAGPFTNEPEAQQSSAAGSTNQSSAAGSKRYSHTVESRGDVRSDFQTFARIGRQTLGDIRGWTLNHNIGYERVSSGEDFRLILASPEAVERAHPVCSSRWSCTVGDQVLINDRRWRKTTPTWPLSRRAYRSYVVNHEVGHWLGLGHADCPGRGRRAPVMMQQSKGLGGCEARVWPKFSERAEVAEIRGIGGWPTPPRDAPCTIRGGGEGERLLGTWHADVICGRGGDDELVGRGGFDVLRAHDGDDVLRAGSRADWLGGGRGRDTLRGAAGRDELHGRNGPDRLFGGSWDDGLWGESGPDAIRGKRGDDVLYGGDGADELRGNAHGDELHGNRHSDVLGGGVGHDFVAGGKSGDRVHGASGDDRLLGRNGSDRLFGGPHADSLAGHSGDDLLDGKGGFDDCDPGPGTDVVRNCER